MVALPKKRLESYLRGKAHQSRRTGHAGDQPEGRWCGHAGPRIARIRMVQNVKDVCPDFTAEPLGELHLLKDRAVEVPVTLHIDQTVTRHIAEGRIHTIRVVLAGYGRHRNREYRSVEVGLPRPYSRIKNLRRAGDVWTLCVAGGVQVIRVRREVERRPRSGVKNACQLPAVESPFDDAARFAGEGNLPDEARSEGVRPIEVGAAMAQFDVGGRADGPLVTAREINRPPERVVACEQKAV